MDLSRLDGMAHRRVKAETNCLGFWPGIYNIQSLKPGANESQKTLNICETRNKTVFHTCLRQPETKNRVPLNSVLRIKQTGV